ncbi:Rv3654c family TadE-like protein [Gordonia sp. NPDC003424]
MTVWRDDRGVATVLGAFAIAALMAAIVAGLYLGAAVLARHRAQSAADLAALAAAMRHVDGAADPCATARAVAAEQRTGAELVSCGAVGADVVVRAGVRVALGPFGLRQAVASARAGPVD